MGSPGVIQTSFNSGEWAPNLYGRVDLTKYHSGAALLRNFYVDYRGGATARAGTRYILQAKGGGAGNVRLIRFQASFLVSYVLEFGEGYLRFFNSGAPVLESAKTITGATKANPGVITSATHGYSNGDWIYITGVGGMTQLNGNYYIVANATTNTFTLTDLNGVPVNTTSYGTYTLGGSAQRVYTITSPYLASELAQIKFAQNVNTMVLCHPNHPPYILTLNTATNWTLNAITFGSTATTPTGLAYVGTYGAGDIHFSYQVTAVDSNGQESGSSIPLDSGGIAYPGSGIQSGTITWTTVVGAASYNIYRTSARKSAALPAGSQYGFMGNVTGTTFVDTNQEPDFSQGPPIPQNPFQGSGVQSITLTAPGTGYTSVPAVSLTAAPLGGVNAVAYASLEVASGTVNNKGGAYILNDTLYLSNGIVLRVDSLDVPSGGGVNTFTILNRGYVGSGSVPSNPVAVVSTVSGFGVGANFNFVWRVGSLGISNPGAGYSVAPTVTFTGGGGSGAAGTTALGAPSAGNPTVPGFFQQRLFLAGPSGDPQQFNMSQPGHPYNYDTTFPAQPDNGYQGRLVSNELNTIQSMLPTSAGLVMLADRQAWLINGGSAGSAISAIDIVANAQAYNGSTYLPPIASSFDILYVQAKGSIVRDLAYNFYTNVYTGADISVLSSHLFYGYQILEWAYAEEPFKIIWAVRSDGTLLSLTFLKEQELIGWAHSDTTGLFKSVCSVTEQVSQGAVDAVYFVVQRTVNGNTVQYIERMAEQYYPNGISDAWCVDAGIGYNGSPATTFSGAQHLAGTEVTGLADGQVITPFTMPTDGNFTLGTAASKVVVGLAYTPQLQTLPLDLGEPTVQGKRKTLRGIDLKVNQTLGLWLGRTFDTLVAMKDLVRGNIGSQSNTRITDLVSGDVRTIVDPQWDPTGQFCVEQPYPMPASILAVIPEIQVGDTK